jgi:hypothetical protein
MCQSGQWHFAKWFQFAIVCVFTVTQGTQPPHLLFCKGSSGGKKIIFHMWNTGIYFKDKSP